MADEVEKARKRKLARRFHERCNTILASSEKEYLLRALDDYSKFKRIDRLTMAIKALLDTAEKQTLIDLICELIPEQHRVRLKEAVPTQPQQQPTRKPSSTAASHPMLKEDMNSNLSNLSPSLRRKAGPLQSTTIPPRGPLPLGMGIRGGSEYGQGIFVSEVTKGGVAEKSGLRVGDLLMTVNRVSLSEASHTTAVKALQTVNEIKITFYRIGMLPAKISNTKTSWATTTDGYQQKKHEIHQQQHPLSKSTGGTGITNSTSQKTVLVRRKDGSFGISIRGGAEIGLGIFISACDRTGPGYLAGLRPGDQIIQVNDTLFLPSVELEKAIASMTSVESVMLTVVSGARIPEHLYIVDSVEKVPTSRQGPEETLSPNTKKRVQDAAKRMMDKKQSNFGSQGSQLQQDRLNTATSNTTETQIRKLTEKLPKAMRESFLSKLKLYEDYKISIDDLVDSLHKLPIDITALRRILRSVVHAADVDLFDALTISHSSTNTSSKSSRRMSFEGCNRVSILDESGIIPLERPIDIYGMDESWLNLGPSSLQVKDFTKEYISDRKRLQVEIPKNKPLGLTIEGGCDTSDPQLGIRVREARHASAVYLKAGDEILSVAGCSFWGVPHDFATDVILKARKDRTKSIAMEIARAGRSSDIDILVHMQDDESDEDEFV